MDKKNIVLAKKLGEMLKQKQIMMATAESCTGGGIAQVLTEIPGSSAWFDRGFVTYSNQAKVEMLQVSQAVLAEFGAVSDPVAIQMAKGALKNSEADLAVAVTGIAGPDGGSEDKPVGTVYIAWKMTGEDAVCLKYHFQGDRSAVREQTIASALQGCLQQIQWLSNKAR